MHKDTLDTFLHEIRKLPHVFDEKRLLRSGEPFVHSTYTIDADSTAPLSDLLGWGDYCRVDDQIKEGNFPAASTYDYNVESVTLHLLKCEKNITSEKMKEYMNENDLRPAGIRELLIFGAQFYDIRTQPFPVAAFGSEHEDCDGNLYVPCLFGYSGNCDVRLHLANSGWSSLFGFLAANK